MAIADHQNGDTGMRMLLHFISLFFFGDPPMNTTHENVSGSKPLLPVGLDPVVPQCPFRFPFPCEIMLRNYNTILGRKKRPSFGHTPT